MTTYDPKRRWAYALNIDPPHGAPVLFIGTHDDGHDWNQEALEEALDLAQYLAAENLRLRRLLEERCSRAECDGRCRPEVSR